MRTISDAEYLELEAKHRKVAKVETEVGDIVLRKPTKPEWKAAVQKGLCDQKLRDNYDPAERLLQDCCVFPTGDELNAMIEDAPGLVLLCLDPLLHLAGMVAKERAGK